MNKYSIAITIIAVIGWAIVIYGVFTGMKIKATIVNLSSKVEQAEKQVSDMKKEFNEIVLIAGAIDAAGDSFMHAGDIKASSFKADQVKKVNDALGQITSENKTRLSQEWTKFNQSGLINDFRSFVRSGAEQIQQKSQNLAK